MPPTRIGILFLFLIFETFSTSDQRAAPVETKTLENNSEADNPSTEEVQGDIKTEADSKEESRETKTKE